MTHHMATEEIATQAWTWKNRPGYKPILILIAGLVFLAIVMLPPPQSMLDMVRKADPPGYKLGTGCNTIVDTVNKKLRPEAFTAEKQGQAVSTNHDQEPLLTDVKVAQLAKIMVGILFLAAFLWGTEALPLGATDLLVAVLLYRTFLDTESFAAGVDEIRSTEAVSEAIGRELWAVEVARKSGR